MEILERIRKLNKQQLIHYQEQKLFLFASGFSTKDSVYMALDRAEKI
jgi:hypothetical protein